MAGLLSHNQAMTRRLDVTHSQHIIKRAAFALVLVGSATEFIWRWRQDAWLHRKSAAGRFHRWLDRLG